ncbi:MAG: OmpH family outer membrane protein [Nitrospira sp.]|nr:OmpH family outer membrane protein [Nitrospira sp.]
MTKISVEKLFIVCLLLFAFSVLPVSLPAAENIKFGAIDVQKILNESEAGKKAKTDLESLIKSKQVSIDEKGKAIEKMKADIEKQASVLSADARKTKEDELEKLIREYQRLVQDSQAEVKKREAELTDGILKDIREIIDKIGEEEGYTLIVEKGMIVYSSKGIDVTDSIIKKFDELRAKSKK